MNMERLVITKKEDVECWTLLKRLDEDTLNNVKFFKAHGDKLWATLKDRRFIAVGNNKDGYLGLGHKREVNTFEEIKTLKDKLIKDIVAGSEHVMVLTEDGQVWGWGYNGHGQVGVSNTQDQLLPRRIFDKDIADVKCGWGNTFALNKSGKLMAWGWNNHGQLGIGSEKSQTKPVPIVNLKNVIIEKIDAGAFHTIAVTPKGKAYGWGSNTCNELGLPQKKNMLQPVKLSVPQQSIKSAVCSSNQTLFLTQNGLMYVTNSKNSILQLVKTDANIEHIACVNFILIDPSSTFQLFLVWSSNKTYYWGETQNVLYSKPISTNLSLPQIISRYCQFQVFPLVLYVQQEKKTPVNRNCCHLNSLGQLLDSAFMSDIEFIFPTGQSIKAHRLILSTSPFLSFFCSKNPSISKVSIDSHPYPVFYNYLFFVYTHTLSYKTINQLVSLVHLAREYKERDLEQECVSRLSSKLNNDTCVRVYKLAIDLKLDELAKQASEVIIKNMAKVKLTEDFKNMSAEKKLTLFDKM